MTFGAVKLGEPVTTHGTQIERINKHIEKMIKNKQKEKNGTTNTTNTVNPCSRWNGNASRSKLRFKLSEADRLNRKGEAVEVGLKLALG